MQRRVRGVGATLLLLVMASGLIAANEPAQPVGPSPAPDSISEALCGRAGRELNRAEALDSFSLEVVPDIWRKATVEDLRRWAGALRCVAASPNESVKFKNRRSRLDQLLERIEDAGGVDDLRASLMALARKQPTSNDWSKADLWPSTTECTGCGELRRAASAALRTAGEWRKRKPAGPSIGARLDAVKEDDALLAGLCAARPSPPAAEEMTRRFRYYTWTAGGAWLLEVAAWFKRLEVTDTCGRT
jgi:hypothetical protein